MPGTVVSGWRVISEWADQTKILTSHSSIPAPRNGAEIQGLDVGLRQFHHTSPLLPISIPPLPGHPCTPSGPGATSALAHSRT